MITKKVSNKILIHIQGFPFWLHPDGSIEGMEENFKLVGLVDA